MTTFKDNLNTEYLIGLPSGQIIDIHYKEINNLKQDGLISLNAKLMSYAFKDEDYLKILQFLKRPRYSKGYMDDLMEFFDRQQKTVRSYQLCPDGSVEVSGSIFVANFPYKKIPYKFKRVSGDFIWRNSKIESLEGCPTEVGGSFLVNGNNLFDLIGGPKYVGEIYDCSSNCLNSLEGSPEKIYTDFDCHDNFLQDLKGGPKFVKGTFDCSGNPLKNTKDKPECDDIITDVKKIAKFNTFDKKAGFKVDRVRSDDGKWR